MESESPDSDVVVDPDDPILMGRRGVAVFLPSSPTRVDSKVQGTMADSKDAPELKSGDEKKEVEASNSGFEEMETPAASEPEEVEVIEPASSAAGPEVFGVGADPVGPLGGQGEIGNPKAEALSVDDTMQLQQEKVREMKANLDAFTQKGVEMRAQLAKEQFLYERAVSDLQQLEKAKRKAEAEAEMPPPSKKVAAAAVKDAESEAPEESNAELASPSASEWKQGGWKKWRPESETSSTSLLTGNLGWCHGCGQKTFLRRDHRFDAVVSETGGLPGASVRMRCANIFCKQNSVLMRACRVEFKPV